MLVIVILLVVMLLSEDNMRNHRKSANSVGQKKRFSRTAGMTHKKNIPSAMPMRGGIRL